MQVLKDAELRAAYDMQLLEAGHEKGLFISAEVLPSPSICPVSASSPRCTAPVWQESPTAFLPWSSMWYSQVEGALSTK